MQHLDAALFKLINHGLASPVLDPIMVAATALGTGVAQTALSFSILLAGWIWDRVSVRRAGYAALTACVGALIAVQLAKMIWSRPRPLLALYDVRVLGDPLFTNSFPSGHTTTAFAVAIAACMFAPKLRFVLMPLAALVGLSRVYVGAHFPLDIVFGAAMGTLVGLWAAGIVKSKTAVTLRVSPEPHTGRHQGE